MLRQLAAAVLPFALCAYAIAPAATPATAEPPSGRFNFYAEPMGQLMRVQLNFGSNVLAGALEAALLRSRDAARLDSWPVPDNIRAGLTPFYSDELLDSIRYKIGDVTPDGLAGFAIRNGNAAAVTLVDTIIFKDEAMINNLALWAHEVHHVEQYRDWGVNGFAARYTFGWDSVESEARARASEFVTWYRGQHG